ncbi:MAG: hypothetical protein QW196_08145 [Sulfolobales archaeon]
MKLTKNFRRGQSEIIGAAIALSLLIAVGLSIFTAFFRSTTQVSADLSSRYRFESEKAAELKGLEVRYGEDRKCRLVNTGNLDVKIVRVWWANGTYKDSSLLTNPILKPGGDDGGKLYELGVNYIVTSRGNVVPIKAACEAKKAITEVIVIGIEGLRSENYLNSSKLVGNDLTKRIVTNVTKGTTTSRMGVLYKYNNIWYYNEGEGWFVDQTTTADEDIDDNGINELIVVNRAPLDEPKTIYNTSLTGKGDVLIVEVTFVQLLKVLDNPDVITIYFKVLADIGTAPPQQVMVSTSVTIRSNNRSITSTASTSSGSFARGRGTERSNVLVIVGSVSFPIRAYEVLREILTPGLYDLTLTIRFDPSGGSGSVSIGNIRLEYVAVTGSASINWQP